MGDKRLAALLVENKADINAVYKVPELVPFRLYRGQHSAECSIQEQRSWTWFGLPELEKRIGRDSPPPPALCFPSTTSNMFSRYHQHYVFPNIRSHLICSLASRP
jgi:hypothetical protein